MLRRAAIVLVSGMLAACSSHPAPTDASAPAVPAPAATNVLAGTPLAPYGHDLNKARNVQNIVDERAKQEAAQIDAATGSSSH